MPKVKIKSQPGRTILDSRINIEPVQVTPAGAPNVIYIVMDDMGFAHLGCYGSTIHTPNLDRLADEGLRYNNFHTTAICSATRASLLTGANHHAVGIASVCELVTGCENGQGHIDNAYATIAEILKQYDYATYCSGKWHLSTAQSPAGPYDQWPLGRGFDRYYGYLQAEIDQYHPSLYNDNTEVDPPKTVAEGYHLSEDLVDHAIDYVFEHNMAYPEQPFFLYLAFGAMHAPHHAPEEYIDRYKGKFDEGWDAIRQKWFENQKRIGIIPQDAELNERNAYVKPWDELTEKQKKVYARYMEAYAGMLEYTDEQIGRLLDYLQESEQLDNTVIVFLSDNGASGEGGAQGKFNCFSGVDITSELDEEEQLAFENIDKIGTEYALNHYPTGWANAGNTPFQWYKQWTHEGGVKDPLIIRYPKLIKDPGGIRGQYHHVSDLTPTILDILGVEKPEIIKGIPQKPFTGTSLKYTFADPEAPDQKHVQYYEITGNRAIYKDGWKATTVHTFNESYDEDVWELYHVAEDYSEKYNVADQYPKKLEELKEEFLIEAGRNNVFPMLRGPIHANRASAARLYGDRRYLPEKTLVFKNVIKPYELTGPQTQVNTDMATHEFTAEIWRDGSGDDGVIIGSGDRFGGYALYIKNNRLKYAYNLNQYEYFVAESETEVPTGDVTVGYEFVRQGWGAKVTILINGVKVGGTVIKRFYLSKGPSTTLKANKHTPVYEDYEVPFEFKGKLKKVTIHQHEEFLDLKTELERAFSID